MSAQTDRLDEVRSSLESALVEQVGTLLGRLQATREVARRMATIEDSIDRTERQARQLDDEIRALEGKVASHTVAALQHRAEELRAELTELQGSRDELTDRLAHLVNQLEDQGRR